VCSPPPLACAPPTPAIAADLSPWDLPLDLYELWEERVCIMHYDGRLTWEQAEALALAEVLCLPAWTPCNTERKPAVTSTQRVLFDPAQGSGPY
jgi:hypothetical protein